MRREREPGYYVPAEQVRTALVRLEESVSKAVKPAVEWHGLGAEVIEALLRSIERARIEIAQEQVYLEEVR